MARSRAEEASEAMSFLSVPLNIAVNAVVWWTYDDGKVLVTACDSQWVLIPPSHYPPFEYESFDRISFIATKCDGCNVHTSFIWFPSLNRKG